MNWKHLRRTYKNFWHIDLAAIKAKEVGGDQFKHYNNLILQERERIASRRLKRILGKFKGNGLTQAVVTKNDGSILEFNTKEEIEIACHEENRKKFAQTNNTPIVHGALAKDVG